MHLPAGRRLRARRHGHSAGRDQFWGGLSREREGPWCRVQISSMASCRTCVPGAMQTGLGPTNDPRQQTHRPQLLGTVFLRSGDIGISALTEEPLTDDVMPVRVEALRGNRSVGQRVPQASPSATTANIWSINRVRRTVFRIVDRHDMRRIVPLGISKLQR